MDFKAPMFSYSDLKHEDRGAMHRHNAHHKIYKMLLKFFEELTPSVPGIAYLLPVFQRATAVLLDNDLKNHNETIVHTHKIGDN